MLSHIFYLTLLKHTPKYSWNSSFPTLKENNWTIEGFFKIYSETRKEKNTGNDKYQGKKRVSLRQARNRNSPFLSVIPGLFRAPQKDMLLDFFSKAMIPVPQFSSVQFSPSVVWLFATPRTAARQASLPITSSRRLLKLLSVESVMPSNQRVLG